MGEGCTCELSDCDMWLIRCLRSSETRLIFSIRFDYFFFFFCRSRNTITPSLLENKKQNNYREKVKSTFLNEIFKYIKVLRENVFIKKAAKKKS
ncbi:hypothetical protein GDO78_002207 [Eleutherodactylus coqui]|uniref:Uncharacterized protein n=1 Tax=Eleutherodactylus coqui TaxID=57060 RepID=A0A8J6K0M9_ELECQ|nr:hypothetical protein GDO78_002207 [Eleutherodactylus coqui]